jgi:methylenetetrahydrofolate dehydrogenase (NADP+)/methenyltetrahydrofolate cyclohydrolase
VTAVVVDGGAEARRRIDDLAAVVPGLRLAWPPTLAVVAADTPEGRRNLEVKLRMGERARVRVRIERVPADVDTAGAVAAIAALADDPTVDGLFVQFPLPAGVDERVVAEAIPPTRDVDGSGPDAAYGPAAVDACLQLLAPWVGERAVRCVALVAAAAGRVASGPSPVFLDRLAAAFAAGGATVVVTDAGRPDWPAASRTADVLVSAAGIPGLVTGEHVRPGAIVVDAGVSRVDGAVVGDVDLASVADVAGVVVPSPGGLGPMTVAVLLQHTVTAARTGRPPRPPRYLPLDV